MRTILGDQHLERAASDFIFVGIAGSGSIKADPVAVPLDPDDLIGLDEAEAGSGIDKPADKPAGGRPIDSYVCPRNPQHKATSPFAACGW
jgi:hypothetical protein